MKYLFFIFFIITNLSHSYANNQLLLHKEAKNIPDIKLNSLNYEDYSVLSASKKNLYIVNFWATWCAPCIKEIPELHELDKNFEKIQVFLFNFDRLQGDELEEQLMKFNVSLPALITDPSNFFDIDVPDALPVSFIIDPNLSLSLTLKGPQTEESILEAINYSE